MNRRRRLMLAVVLAVGAAWTAVDTASACYCAAPSYPAAIADADVAFVGTVVTAEEPDAPSGIATYTLAVIRSKGPLDNPSAMQALFGDGANCGVDMAVGEEWLVIARVSDARLRTTLCDGSAPIARLDADTRALLDASLVPIGPMDGAPVPRTVGPSAWTLPAVAAVAVLVVVGCALAFRRAAR